MTAAGAAVQLQRVPERTPTTEAERAQMGSASYGVVEGPLEPQRSAVAPPTSPSTLPALTLTSAAARSPSPSRTASAAGALAIERAMRPRMDAWM